MLSPQRLSFCNSDRTNGFCPKSKTLLLITSFYQSQHNAIEFIKAILKPWYLTSFNVTEIYTKLPGDLKKKWKKIASIYPSANKKMVIKINQSLTSSRALTFSGLSFDLLFKNTRTVQKLKACPTAPWNKGTLWDALGFQTPSVF